MKIEKNLTTVTVSFNVDSDHLEDLDFSLKSCLERFVPSSHFNIEHGKSHTEEYELEKTNKVFFIEGTYYRNFSISKSYALEISDDNYIFLSGYSEPNVLVYDLDIDKQKTSFKNVNKKNQDNRIYYRLHRIKNTDLYVFFEDESIISGFSLSDAESVANTIQTYWKNEDEENFTSLLEDFVNENKRSSKQMELFLRTVLSVFYNSNFKFNDKKVEMMKVMIDKVKPSIGYEDSLSALGRSVAIASIFNMHITDDNRIMDAYDYLISELLEIPNDKIIEDVRTSVFEYISTAKYASSSQKMIYIVKNVVFQIGNLIRDTKIKTEDDYNELVDKICNQYGAILVSLSFANEIGDIYWESELKKWSTFLDYTKEFNGVRHYLFAECIVKSLKTYKRKKVKTHIDNYLNAIKTGAQSRYSITAKVNKDVIEQLEELAIYENDKTMKKAIMKLLLK